MVIVFALLLGLQFSSVKIIPNFAWYLFCGFCLALSVIAPGMSFSTLLMPLGLYTPFVDGIGHLDMSVLLPGGLGALITVILLAKAVNALFDRHYSLAFHAIIGIVIAATVMIVPYQSFAASVTQCIVNLICLGGGDYRRSPAGSLQCKRCQAGGIRNASPCTLFPTGDLCLSADYRLLCCDKSGVSSPFSGDETAFVWSFSEKTPAMLVRIKIFRYKENLFLLEWMQVR